MDPGSAVRIAVAFTWLGMVLGISFLETPLKFRAPGITVPLAVGIGRLVFRALNGVEAVFAVVLIVTVFTTPSAAPWWTAGLVIAVAVVLAAGAGVLRPRMDARVERGATSDGHPSNALHVGYVLLECAKAPLLLAVGVTGLLA